jgi:hypothetical protein
MPGYRAALVVLASMIGFGSACTPPPPPPTSVARALPAPMPRSEAPAHPGMIIIVDGETNEVVDMVRAADLPEGARFQRTEKGLIPIVKLVAKGDCERRMLLAYGPGGELLRSTVDRP